jgi:hypothetical protein
MDKSINPVILKAWPVICQSKWPCGHRHELPLPARVLGFGFDSCAYAFILVVLCGV